MCNLVINSKNLCNHRNMTKLLHISLNSSLPISTVNFCVTLYAYSIAYIQKLAVSKNINFSVNEGLSSFAFFLLLKQIHNKHKLTPFTMYTDY